VVLVGVTGDGKSSTGNTLCGRQAFRTSDGLCSATAACEHADYLQLGACGLMRVVDTIGLQDTALPAAEVLRRFSLFAERTPLGINAFLFVVRWGRFKPEHEVCSFVPPPQRQSDGHTHPPALPRGRSRWVRGQLRRGCHLVHAARLHALQALPRRTTRDSERRRPGVPSHAAASLRGGGRDRQLGPTRGESFLAPLAGDAGWEGEVQQRRSRRRKSTLQRRAGRRACGVCSGSGRLEERQRPSDY